MGYDRHMICIEDPFETSRDLGRVVDQHTVKILRAEFARAADILQYDPVPSVTLFEPYATEDAESWMRAEGFLWTLFLTLIWF